MKQITKEIRKILKELYAVITSPIDELLKLEKTHPNFKMLSLKDLDFKHVGKIQINDEVIKLEVFVENDENIYHLNSRKFNIKELSDFVNNSSF